VVVVVVVIVSVSLTVTVIGSVGLRVAVSFAPPFGTSIVVDFFNPPGIITKDVSMVPKPALVVLEEAVAVIMGLLVCDNCVETEVADFELVDRVTVARVVEVLGIDAVAVFPAPVLEAIDEGDKVDEPMVVEDPDASGEPAVTVTPSVTVVTEGWRVTVILLVITSEPDGALALVGMLVVVESEPPILEVMVLEATVLEAIVLEAMAEELETDPLRMREAVFGSKQPSLIPAVVFMGRAKHCVLSGQGMTEKVPELLHSARFPVTHAAWPVRQAESSVKLSNRLLYLVASAKLLA
jgi:hypothetical protein